MICARSVSSVRRGRTVCVSGSPNRTLYSSTFGPLDVNMNPVNKRPTNGYPGYEMTRVSGVYRLFACRQLLVAGKSCGFPRGWQALLQERERSNPCRQCLVLDLHRKHVCDLGLGEGITRCSRRRMTVYLSHRLPGIPRLRLDRLKVKILFKKTTYQLRRRFYPPLFP